MRYGLQLGGGAAVRDKAVLRQVGQLAEELGYEAILIGDHIAFPKTINSDYPYLKQSQDRGQNPYAIFTQMEWLDSFTVLAFLVDVTETIRLGTSVTIIPYRHPLEMARVVATLDVLSGGRFILGAGVGWMEEEFRLLGIPFRERAARTREYISVMQEIWTEENPRFAGEFVQIEQDLHFAPKPLQKPYPPIWVGGESLPALRRVVEFGNGWHIGPLAAADIKPKLDTLRQLTQEAGRDFSELALTVLVDGSTLSAADIKAYNDIGIHSLYTLAAVPGPEAMLAQVREFADKVKNAVE